MKIIGTLTLLRKLKTSFIYILGDIKKISELKNLTFKFDIDLEVQCHLHITSLRLTFMPSLLKIQQRAQEMRHDNNGSNH